MILRNLSGISNSSDENINAGEVLGFFPLLGVHPREVGDLLTRYGNGNGNDNGNGGGISKMSGGASINKATSEQNKKHFNNLLGRSYIIDKILSNIKKSGLQPKERGKKKKHIQFLKAFYHIN